MQTFVIVIHLMVVLAMIGVVLLQKSEGGGLGMGGGGGGGFLSSRGTANVLTRATAILAAVFFATSLILSILAGFSRNPSTILHNTSAPAGPVVPGTPGTPAAPAGGGVLDQLRQQENTTPAPGTPVPGTPAAPAAPQPQ